MLRPSTFGAFSITAISESAWAKSSRICLLLFICVISRPRKRSVTFTLSPFVMNFLAALTFVFKSFVSMFGDNRISLISMTFCFFLASFSGLFVFELPVIHDFADRRFCRRRNFYQIDTCLFRKFQRVPCRHNAELFPAFSNDSDFFVPNLFVNE